MFVAAENNVPFVSLEGTGNDGNESLTTQWTVSEQGSVTLTTSDADNEDVWVFGWEPLPTGSTLTQKDSNTWQFAWTPMNMDPVELVWVAYRKHYIALSFHLDITEYRSLQAQIKSSKWKRDRNTGAEAPAPRGWSPEWPLFTEKETVFWRIWVIISVKLTR